VPVAAFFIGVCMPIVEANRRREETQALLEELETAHAELESAYAELKNYAERVRELAVSEERARMAREMHGSVGHYLTVVNVQLEAATKLMDGNPERAREEVAKAKALASDALSEVRRSVRALKPLAVERRSVIVALSALAQDFEGAGPTVAFKVEGEERNLPTEVELALYRALQESMTNALKHSRARQISISLIFGEESVRLKVTDDGAGAPEDAYERGFGLTALRERAEALGGTLKAGNTSEGGFALEVELPTGPS
jgi:signal transduction histidine kinase